MTLGENLQNLRKEKGLSQEEVAQSLFVTRQTISKWETDKAEPGVSNLKALAGLYTVPLERLMEGEELAAWVLSLCVACLIPGRCGADCIMDDQRKLGTVWGTLSSGHHGYGPVAPVSGYVGDPAGQ